MKYSEFGKILNVYSLNNVKAIGKYVIILLAVMLISPYFSFAISPANPWAKTPNLHASSLSYPCAIKPSRIPVKTSPLPAVAIPGLPVELK